MDALSHASMSVEMVTLTPLFNNVMMEIELMAMDVAPLVKKKIHALLSVMALGLVSQVLLLEE